MKSIAIKLFILTTCFGLISCTSQDQRILEGGNQVQLRSMQTRAFDTQDKQLLVRTVISTLQDLSFVIDKADVDLGTVSGTRLGGHQIRMTVTVRPRSEQQMLVRANARYNLKAIEDPEMYQDFFNSLGKAVFLTAHNVD